MHLLQLISLDFVSTYFAQCVYILQCDFFIFIYLCYRSKHFLEETNTFIQQGCIKLIESDSKEDIYNVRKGFYFKRILFFSLHQRFFPQKC